MTNWTTAVLGGGPADGLRIQAADRPSAIQVTYPCVLDARPGGVRAPALYTYRLGSRAEGEPLRYGFDGAIP